MPFHVRDPETDALVRELARERGCGITEAVKLAVGNELTRMKPPPDARAQIRRIQQEIAAAPRTGLEADKAFYDWLSGDED